MTSVVRRTAAWLALAVAVLLAPAPGVHPTTVSLTAVGTAKEVDFGGDGVLWVLALGSDARPGQDVTEGNTDAIHLVGIDWRSRRAVAIGVPRDFYVELPGGRARINSALTKGGPDLAAAAVADVVGITPDLVLVTGFDGFRAMMGAVGDIEVDSPLEFTSLEGDLQVSKGINTFDAEQALDYARSRRGLTTGDLARSANQQRVLEGALRGLRTREDEEGFVERTALAALAGLQTDLSPTEVYRFVQALTQVDPRRVTGCVLTGTPTVAFGAQVLVPDVEQARRVGADAQPDARLQGGC